MQPLLISDANVLIDIEFGDFTSSIFLLPYDITVPDVLFEQEMKERHSQLLDLGLKVKSLTAEAVQQVHQLIAKHSQPSVLDHFALALALQEKCPLLTGDKALARAARSENVEVHGTLWLIERLLDAGRINSHQAKQGFENMKTMKSRLPWGDVETMLARYPS